MQFDIDYARAKAMASSLQDFLKDKPEGALTRSSAIEAVALMLGFPNRNTMAATMGDKSTVAVAPENRVGIDVRTIVTTQAGVKPESRTDAGGVVKLFAINGKIRDRGQDPENDPGYGLRIEMGACADQIVALGIRSVHWGASFDEMIQTETERGTNLLTSVENEIAYKLISTECLVSLMSDFIRSGDTAEKALREARKDRQDERYALALAVVNLSLPVAKEMWEEEVLLRFLAGEVRDCASELVMGLARGVHNAPKGADFMTLLNWPDASGRSLHDQIAAKISKDLSRDEGRFHKLYQALNRFQPEHLTSAKPNNTPAITADALVKASTEEAQRLFDTVYGVSRPF